MTLEKDIERKLVKAVESRGGYCFKWVCPGMAGVPDRIILLPGPGIIFAETKKPKGGKLSALQIYIGKLLTRLGFDYRVLWSEKDILALMEFIDNE